MISLAPPTGALLGSLPPPTVWTLSFFILSSQGLSADSNVYFGSKVRSFNNLWCQNVTPRVLRVPGKHSVPEAQHRRAPFLSRDHYGGGAPTRHPLLIHSALALCCTGFLLLEPHREFWCHHQCHRHHNLCPSSPSPTPGTPSVHPSAAASFHVPVSCPPH